MGASVCLWRPKCCQSVEYLPWLGTWGTTEVMAIWLWKWDRSRKNCYFHGGNDENPAEGMGYKIFKPIHWWGKWHFEHFEPLDFFWVSSLRQPHMAVDALAATNWLYQYIITLWGSPNEPLDSYDIGIQNHTIRRPQSFSRNQLFKLCGVSFFNIPFCSESFKKYWLQSGSSSLQVYQLKWWIVHDSWILKTPNSPNSRVAPDTPNKVGNWTRVGKGPKNVNIVPHHPTKMFFCSSPTDTCFK